MLLDLRTAPCKHVDSSVRTSAFDALKDEYIKFGSQCEQYDREEAQKAAQRLAADLKDEKEKADKKRHTRQEKERQKVATVIASSDDEEYDGQGGWSDDDNGCERNQSPETDEEEDEAARTFRLEKEFKKVWDAWRVKMKEVNWSSVDKNIQFKNPQKPGMMELMQVDIGKLYAAMEQQNDMPYGYLPLMAGCSVGQLGALNAESFSERVLSCANNVLHCGNTLLSDEEVEMVTVLRMNRDFMDFMRSHYGNVVRQQFKMTCVEENE